MTLGPDQRRQIEELLPFWINGTLTGDEAAMVAAAVAVDPLLRDQAEALKRLRETLRSGAGEAAPGAFGLARLHRTIAAEPVPRNFWRPTALAALAATLAAFAVFVLRAGPEARQDLYRQASGGDPDRVLTIGFRAEATEGAITDLLLAQDLVIVDGPSALGLYRVQMGKGADARAVAARLNAAAPLISLVELPQ